MSTERRFVVELRSREAMLVVDFFTRVDFSLAVFDASVADFSDGSVDDSSDELPLELSDSDSAGVDCADDCADVEA